MNPLVLVMIKLSAESLKAPLRDSISAAAEPPLGGVNGSCDMKVVLGAISCLSIPQRFSISVTNSSKVDATCATSSLVGWYAEFPI